MEDTKKRVGKWDASQLLQDAQINSSMSEVFLQHQLSQFGKGVKTHISTLYYLHMLHRTTKPSSK